MTFRSPQAIPILIILALVVALISLAGALSRGAQPRQAAPAATATLPPGNPRATLLPDPSLTMLTTTATPVVPTAAPAASLPTPRPTETPAIPPTETPTTPPTALPPATLAPGATLPPATAAPTAPQATAIPPTATAVPQATTVLPAPTVLVPSPTFSAPTSTALPTPTSVPAATPAPTPAPTGATVIAQPTITPAPTRSAIPTPTTGGSLRAITLLVEGTQPQAEIFYDVDDQDLPGGKVGTVTLPWSTGLRLPAGSEIVLLADGPEELGDLRCRISGESIPTPGITSYDPNPYPQVECQVIVR